MKFYRDCERDRRVRYKKYNGIEDEETRKWVIDKNGELRRYYELH